MSEARSLAAIAPTGLDVRPPSPSLRTTIAGAGIVGVAVLLTWLLVLAEVSGPAIDTQWPIFAAAAVLMFVGERTPAAWIRFGPIGIVTPLWFFSFGMLLIGSPSATVGLAAIAATLHALRRDIESSDMVVRVASTVLSLSAAGLAAVGIGHNPSLGSIEAVDTAWAGLIAVAGFLIVSLNAFTAAIWISARRRSRFSSLLRHGLAARVTAEGALLSLAPIWVAGLVLNPVLAPLLAITTILVFRATRQALEQSHEALHDQLTGLLNRQSFLAQVDEAVSSRRRHGSSLVLIMDLNGFKDINDRLGHQTGDALLIAFADRLELARPTDAEVARLGGDEFAVLIRNHGDDPQHLVRKMHAVLTQPLVIDSFPITVGVSIGVARVHQDAHTTTDLVRAADTAMYKAKRTGGTFALYDRSARTHQHGRLNLLSELSAALDDHQLHLNFQPQLRMADGRVDTLEALVRWVHPHYGPIAPSEFIGLAEQTDLIDPITVQVLRTATQGVMAGGISARLAVNVSPRSLEDAEFVNTILSIVAEAGLAPHQLELEMTERELVRQPERTKYAIEKLRSAGVRIAIDDFGVGYSSYQTLRLFDVDRVKIDREFVQGLLASDKDRLIVSSLIELAHALGLDVVAEGVESQGVWNALRELGCDVAQGYGIAVPMDYVEMRRWFADWSETYGGTPLHQRPTA